MSGPRGVRKAWETRRQTEERVLVNIAPEHQALWNRVKTGILGTPHERAEALAQYAHDHPNEAIAAMQEDADAKLAQLIRLREAS